MAKSTTSPQRQIRYVRLSHIYKLHLSWSSLLNVSVWESVKTVGIHLINFKHTLNRRTRRLLICYHRYLKTAPIRQFLLVRHAFVLGMSAELLCTRASQCNFLLTTNLRRGLPYNTRLPSSTSTECRTENFGNDFTANKEDMR